jgi:hypothetical protein
MRMQCRHDLLTAGVYITHWCTSDAGYWQADSVGKQCAQYSDEGAADYWYCGRGDEWHPRESSDNSVDGTVSVWVCRHGRGSVNLRVEAVVHAQLANADACFVYVRGKITSATTTGEYTIKRTTWILADATNAVQTSTFEAKQPDVTADENCRSASCLYTCEV